MAENVLKCRCCGRDLPEGAFYVHPTRGHRSLDCRECMVLLRKQARARRSAARKAIKRRQRQMNAFGRVLDGEGRPLDGFGRVLERRG